MVVQRVDAIKARMPGRYQSANAWKILLLSLASPNHLLRPPLNRRPGIRVKGEGVEVEDMLMIVISIAGVAGVVGEEGGQSPRVAGEPGEEELERSVERFLRRPRWWIHRADIRYHRGPFVPVSLPS